MPISLLLLLRLLAVTITTTVMVMYDSAFDLVACSLY